MSVTTESPPAPAQSQLAATTSGFVLAAAVTALFNTALACAKDSCAPLKDWMTSLTGHDWITHGLADLLLFLGLGFLLANTNAAARIAPARLIGTLIAAIAIAALGLALWYALF
jgi:hypothetical protein